VADSREDKPMTPEMLKGIRDFAKKHEESVQKTMDRVQEAKKAKIASETDEEFLMAALIQKDDLGLAQNLEKADTLVAQKIERMKKDKDEYLAVSNHELVRNTGFLKTSKTEKFAIPKEDDFLKLTVPERRALLKKAKEMLPKAQEYAKKAATEESGKLGEEYTKLLKGALKKKIIGKKTYEKFLNGFNKIDNDEKQSWISEFDDQMKRYEKLWGDIRSTLKGEPLQHMESLRDQMGYTELFAEFGRTCEAEGKKVEGEYEKKLHGYREKEKIIGRHTIKGFMDGEDGIRRQDLKGKTKYLDQLDGQMERYRKLQKEIGMLPKKARDYLESKRDEWGYTELHGQWQRFKNGEKIPESGPKNDPLSVVQNTTVKRAIIEANEKLEKKGGGKRGTFLQRVTKMFMGAQETNFDAKGFGAKLGQDRQEARKKETEQFTPDRDSGPNDFQKELAGKRQAINSTEMDKEAVEDEMDAFKPDKRSHVLKVEGFRQVETQDDSGHSKRSAQVEINRDKGMERFFFEEQQHAYRGKEQGGKDDLSLAVKSEDTGVVEMKLRDIRAMEKFLEEEEKLDKAA